MTSKIEVVLGAIPFDSPTMLRKGTVKAIKQEADLVRHHLKSKFLEEDEDKSVENPTNPSSVFPGPRQVRTRTTLDTPPAPPSILKKIHQLGM
ncbi:hypothetical protein JHK87_007082 [Glycine soja]|nr:hypothetical protein JHK87_007082 [Glycine soja]